MGANDQTERPDDGPPHERIAAVPRSVSRYDLVLAVIPVALAFGAIVGSGPAVPDVFGTAGGSSIALVATGYALFVDPPA